MGSERYSYSHRTSVAEKRRNAPIGTSYCPGCEQYKDEGLFYRDKTRKNGLSRLCKSCESTDIQKPGRKEKKVIGDRARHGSERTKDQRRGRLYNIEPGEYSTMVHTQNNTCAICGKPEGRMINGKTTALAVDHDHDTGAARGLLCYKCNVGLGFFMDNPDALRAAADYLNQYGR